MKATCLLGLANKRLERTAEKRGVRRIERIPRLAMEKVVQIREATEADFGAVMRLYRQLHPDDPILDDGSDWDTYRAIVGAKNFHIFVLELNGHVEATCYLNIVPNITRGASPYAVIENVVTEVSLRGSGLGKAVVGYALEQAWSAGCYKVMLQTGSSRESTHAFYRTCGFRDNDKVAFVARPPNTAAGR